ncbi:hypothetical protein A9Q84_07040 [Halobacteriovorax marinus]|uniref:Serine protease n=1 Tax=Halobacteriovorax marinus TaxID=97084 RepID=A0A1Y5FE20_9BACT|nr:hypothetical protein A9Q84_07040 [Halobacteriovorax marinus]
MQLIYVYIAQRNHSTINEVNMKNMMTFLCLAVLSTPTFAGSVQKVLYGKDDRQEVSSYPNEMFQKLAQSVAGRVSKYDLELEQGSESSNAILDSIRELRELYSSLGLSFDESSLTSTVSTDAVATPGSFYKYSAQTLGDRINACSEERFTKQPTLMSCTGFLVGKDLLVTAGHCMTSNFDCSGNKWVFGFTEGIDKIPSNSVYNCKEVVSQEQISLPFIGTTDYAVIRLDRPVTDRAPLKFRTSGKIRSKADVLVIGHPLGLPLKIADNATVRGTFGKTFNANLDTYGGNSGSPVFNARTGLVEGVLVQGAEDLDYQGSCTASRSENGKKEVIYKITRLKALQKLHKQGNL